MHGKPYAVAPAAARALVPTREIHGKCDERADNVVPRCRRARGDPDRCGSRVAPTTRRGS